MKTSNNELSTLGFAASRHKSACAVLLLALANFANAATDSQLQLDTRAEYEDNPQLLPDDLAEAVWRSVTTPRYTFRRIEDAWELAFNGDLRIQRSSDELLSFNREDPTLGAQFAQRTETTEFTASVNYAQASTRITEFEDSNLLTRDGTRETASASLGWSSNVAATRSYQLGFQAQDVQFEDSPLVDFRSYAVNGAYQWQLSPRASVSALARATRFRPQDQNLSGAPAVNGSIDQDIEFVGAGLSYQFSEQWLGQLNVGWVDVTFDDQQVAVNPQLPDGETLNPSDASWNADASATYSTETTNWSLAVGRQTNASGLGRTVTADSIAVTGAVQLSARNTMSMQLGWRKNTDIIDNESLNGQLAFERSLSERWAVSTAYSYRERDGLLSASSNSVMVSLIYRDLAL